MMSMYIVRNVSKYILQRPLFTMGWLSISYEHFIKIKNSILINVFPSLELELQ